MIKQLRFAFKDFRKNLLLSLMFMFELFLSVFYILYMSNNLINNQLQYRLMNHLKKYNIINFKTYSLDGGEGILLSQALDREMDKILNGEYPAYSFVNLGSNEEHPDIEVIVGLGKFQDVFNIRTKGGIPRDSNEDGFIVLAGSKINSGKLKEGIYIGNIRKEALPVDGRMRKDSFYMALKGYEISHLDNSVLILTTYEQLKNQIPFGYGQKIFSNVGLISPERDRIEAFVNLSEEQKSTMIIPESFNEYMNENYMDKLPHILTISLYYLCAMVFIGLSLAAIITQIMERNLKEYAVHYHYGATLGELSLRSVFFATIIIGIPCILTYNFIGNIRYHSDILLWIMLFITFGAIALASLYPIKNLNKQDITNCLRRD